MLQVYEISDQVTKRDIDANQTEKIQVIIRLVLGEDRMGKPSETRLYKVDENKKSHKFIEYKKNFMDKSATSDQNNRFCDGLADDLLKAELVEDKTQRNKNIKEGTLIVEVTSTRLVVMKLEKVNTIDFDTFDIKTNIGLDRDYFKAAVFTGNTMEIKVVDRQRRVANFWSSKFLELVAVRTSADNTDFIADAVNNNQLFANDIFFDGELEDATKIVAEYLISERSFDLQEISEIIASNFPEKQLDKDELFEPDFLNSIDEQFEISHRKLSVAFCKKIKLNDYTTLVIENYPITKKSQLLSVSGDLVKIKIDDDRLSEVRGLLDSPADIVKR